MATDKEMDKIMKDAMKRDEEAFRKFRIKTYKAIAVQDAAVFIGSIALMASGHPLRGCALGMGMFYATYKGQIKMTNAALDLNNDCNHIFTESAEQMLKAARKDK